VLTIRPSEKGIKLLKTKIRNIIYASKRFENVINELNPILRG